MAKPMHRIDLMEILHGLVSGELFEGVDDDRTLEEQVLIGAALSQLGADITKTAKVQALTIYSGVQGKQIDGRLIIEYRPGGQQTRVDSEAVRKLFPPDDSPELWKKINTRESISVTIGERT